MPFGKRVLIVSITKLGISLFAIAENFKQFQAIRGHSSVSDRIGHLRISADVQNRLLPIMICDNIFATPKKAMQGG